MISSKEKPNERKMMELGVSILSKEMNRFNKLVSRAEDEPMPLGPPNGPLTGSCFASWSLFDACLGLAGETVGTTVSEVGTALGLLDDLLLVILLKGLSDVPESRPYSRVNRR